MSEPRLGAAEPRRWWWAQPVARESDLQRIAALEAWSWNVFPDRPVRLDDDRLRRLIIASGYHPGECLCSVQRLRALLEQAERGAA